MFNRFVFMLLACGLTLIGQKFEVTVGNDFFRQVPQAPPPALVASVSITLKPLTKNDTLKSIYSKGGVGVWTVGICNDSRVSFTLQKTRVMNEFEFADVPNDAAKDLLTRRANASFWNVAGSALAEGLDITATGMAVGGAITSNKAVEIVGAGMKLGAYGVKRANSRKPDPTKYFDRMMPDDIPLGPVKCVPVSFILAEMPKDASKVDLRLSIPLE